MMLTHPAMPRNFLCVCLTRANRVQCTDKHGEIIGIYGSFEALCFNLPLLSKCHASL